MNKYLLPENKLSQYCRGYLNNSGKFVDSTSNQVVDCCLDSCRNKLNYCLKICKKENCLKCKEIYKICSHGCDEIFLEEKDKVNSLSFYTHKQNNKKKTNFIFLFVVIIVIVLFITYLVF